MKTLAKNHVCNHCVIGEKIFKNILIGPGKFRKVRDFRETGPRIILPYSHLCTYFLQENTNANFAFAVAVNAILNLYFQGTCVDIF